ncbi:MAG: hypothetical protein GX592_11865 [Clostridiales bacterium]|nr:hypothetical protein [Clostridiales bacterium]
MKKAGLTLLVLAIIALSFFAVNSPKGTVREEFSETGCRLEFDKWSERSNCELPLRRGDELRVAIVLESGTLALDIHDGGTEAYTGNGLGTGTFTVKAPEAGEYVVVIRGDGATGSIEIDNLSR